MNVRTRPFDPSAVDRPGLPRRAATDLLVTPAVLGGALIAAALLGASLPAWALAGALAGYALSGSV
jgi:hypothetical protein